METRQRNRVDAMADFREDMKALMATLGGDFDSRIAELKKLKKEIHNAQSSIATVAEANAIMAKAKAFDDSLQSAAEQAALNAGTEAKRLEDETKALAQREEAATKGLAKLTELEKKFVKEKELFAKDAADQTIALDKRALDLSRRESALEQETGAVAKLKVQLATRLEALSKVK